MRPTRLVTIAAATAAATLALGGAPVGGQEEPAPLPVTAFQTGGSAGNHVAYSGEGCITENPPGSVRIDIHHVDSSTTIWSFTEGAGSDGSWAGGYIIEADDPLGSYEVRATCYEDFDPNAEPPGTVVQTYSPGTFEVTGEPGSTGVTISVDPTSGPIGTTISVSGGGCVEQSVLYGLLAGTSLDDATHVVSEGLTDRDANGDWSGELVVYEDMGDIASQEIVMAPVVPGDDYFVVALCGDVEGEQFVPYWETGAVAFDITGDGAAPDRTDTPKMPTIRDAAPAQPATPVAGEPTYTG